MTAPTDHVLLDITDGIATITLNRPERRIAMSPEMAERRGERISDASSEEEEED